MRTRPAAALLLLFGLGAAAGATDAPRAARPPKCALVVNNRTPYRALVHLDGVYWGWVNAHQTFTFKGVPRGDRIAYATTQYAEHFWGPKPIKCETTATWNLAF